MTNTNSFALTYVEVEYKRDWLSVDPDDTDAAGSASFFVRRESKNLTKTGMKTIP